mmetsp:Transcript_81637/g.253729  ORF Transcript_81637/g.253729 Transcript_81637/m.253729 type:complete len:276 (-) Transcript_81637:2078-2905(-)
MAHSHPLRASKFRATTCPMDASASVPWQRSSSPAAVRPEPRPRSCAARRALFPAAALAADPAVLGTPHRRARCGASKGASKRGSTRSAAAGGFPGPPGSSSTAIGSRSPSQPARIRHQGAPCMPVSLQGTAAPARSLQGLPCKRRTTASAPRGLLLDDQIAIPSCTKAPKRCGASAFAAAMDPGDEDEPNHTVPGGNVDLGRALRRTGGSASLPWYVMYLLPTRRPSCPAAFSGHDRVSGRRKVPCGQTTCKCLRSPNLTRATSATWSRRKASSG